MRQCAVIVCGIICFLSYSSALDYKQWVNTEFLLNEGAQPKNGPINNKYQNHVALNPPVTPKSTSTTALSSVNFGSLSLNDREKFPPLGQPVTPTSTSTTVSRTVNSHNNPQSPSGKRDYVAPQLPTVKPVQNSNNAGPQNNRQLSDEKRDYVAQFAPLKPVQNHAKPVQNSNNADLQNNRQAPDGKRDYIAQFAPLKPVQNQPKPVQNNNNADLQNNRQAPDGKRDYVAQFAPLKPVQNHPKPVQNSNNADLQINRQAPDGKRDYDSQFPPLKPSQNPNGGVKDLINFYENKSNVHGQSSATSQGFTNKLQSITTPKPMVSTIPMSTKPISTNPMNVKPMSFSSVVAGSTKLSTAAPNKVRPQTAALTTPLPSSIVNRNRGTSANNGHTITDLELQNLSEELLRKDSNNAARYITINYQGKTTSQSQDDMAPQPLLTILPEVWEIPTVQKFLPLLDNYERDVLVNEHVTPQERIEEIAFMDAVMSTPVMRHLMLFLKNKGYVSPDPQQQKEFVKQLWFSLYSRGKGKLSSSGFEHTFVSELKNGGISGLHNWIYFHREEIANRVNYLGYLKYLPLSEKGVVLKFHFNQQGVDKPVNSMFIGTSPELELALYTLCYVTRVEQECNLRLGSKDVKIITYNFRYRSKDYVGSAYPQF